MSDNYQHIMVSRDSHGKLIEVFDKVVTSCDLALQAEMQALEMMIQAGVNKCHTVLQLSLRFVSTACSI